MILDMRRVNESASEVDWLDAEVANWIPVTMFIEFTALVELTEFIDMNEFVELTELTIVVSACSLSSLLIYD